MPKFTVPDGDPLHEVNDCHTPAGSPAGGQFCSKGEGGTEFTPIQHTGWTPPRNAGQVSGLRQRARARRRERQAQQDDRKRYNQVMSMKPEAIADRAQMFADSDLAKRAAASGRSVGDLERERERHRREDLRDEMARSRRERLENMTVGDVERHEQMAKGKIANPPRVTLRQTTYRDKPGYMISAPAHGGRGPSRIFTTDENKALRIKGAIRRGASSDEIDNILLGRA